MGRRMARALPHLATFMRLSCRQAFRSALSGAVSRTRLRRSFSSHASACFTQPRHWPRARNGLSGICFVPIELEVSRQPTTVGTQMIQIILSAWLPRNAELTGAEKVNLNFIAFLEPQRIRHNRRNADGETVAPFCNLH